MSSSTQVVAENNRRRLEDLKSLRRVTTSFLKWYPDQTQLNRTFNDVNDASRNFHRPTSTNGIALPVMILDSLNCGFDVLQALVPHLPLKYQKLRWCVSQNSHFIRKMVKAFELPIDMSTEIGITKDQSMWHNYDNHLLPGEVNSSHSGTQNGMFQIVEGDQNGKVATGEYDATKHGDAFEVSQARSVMRNIVRDWAAEGQKERDECFKPILEELERLFPNCSENRHPTCLVPGAGLGRLAFEISRLGFMCQGNEFSYYMLMCSSFLLKNCKMAEEWTIYPWIHSNCNSLSDNDQLRPVSIPDIHPASTGIPKGLSMRHGDFVEIYDNPTQAGAWDAVVTCFFIDTAHNVIKYIEIISKILKDGGVWINLGPLLYHFSDMLNPDDEMSIELNLEDVKSVAYHYGFIMERESTLASTYSSNPRSMMKNWYYPVFWTMRKKSSAAKE